MIRENLKNIVYQTFAQIIPRALMFVFIFYLAGKLGSTEYGKYDFSMSIGFLIGVFFELGGNVMLTKYVARGFYSSYGYSLKFRIVSILVTFSAVFGFFLISGQYKPIIFHLVAATTGIAFSSLMNLNFAFFRGLKKMNYEAIVLIVQKVLFISFSLIFLLQNGNSFYMLFSFALSMIISWIIIQWIFLKQHHKYSAIGEDKQVQFKEYFKDVMSLALVEVFAIIYFRVTQIFLESYAGFSQVGIYGVSYKLVEAFTNIPSILMIVLFPGFAKLAVENRALFKVQFNKVLRMLIIMGLVSSAICWLFGKPIFELLGKDYGESYILIRYMTLALTAIFPNYLLTQSLIALDKNLKYASVLFAVLALNIIISFILVPKFGAYGSAITVGICEVIIFISCYLIINKILNASEAKA